LLQTAPDCILQPGVLSFIYFLSQIRLGGYLDLRLLAALKFEYDYLILVLEQNSGNVQRALGAYLPVAADVEAVYVYAALLEPVKVNEAVILALRLEVSAHEEGILAALERKVYLLGVVERKCDNIVAHEIGCRSG